MFQNDLRKDEDMKFKKAIATGTVAAAFVSSVLNVSAAGMTNEDYMNALKKDGKESRIIDVEAYKAAYSDLAAAFGDDWGAYIEHYLTHGVYEGRMEGVLFDPLTYAEAYSDIKEAYGDNILAIANHYKTAGIAENRTIGTAIGYADMAEAKKAEAAAVATPKAGSSVSTAAADNGNAVAKVNALNDSDSNNSNVYAGEGRSDNGTSVVNDNSVAVSQNNSAPDTGNTNTSAVITNADTSSSNSNAAAADSGVPNQSNYQHVTTIYHDDGETLWRKEYYDENNKLSEYSSITDVDNSTNSYTENIYKWDEEKDEQVLQRTDTYKNGELVSSESP